MAPGGGSKQWIPKMTSSTWGPPWMFFRGAVLLHEFWGKISRIDEKMPGILGMRLGKFVCFHLVNYQNASCMCVSPRLMSESLHGVQFADFTISKYIPKSW